MKKHAVIDETAEVTCPWCGETCTIFLDAGGPSHESYVEECSVCCRPWDVRVTRDGGAAEATAERADG